MVTDAFNHAPAQIFLNTGATDWETEHRLWLTYDSAASQELPGFVVMLSEADCRVAEPPAGQRFCPLVTKQSSCSQGDPILCLEPSNGSSAGGGRSTLFAT